MAKTKITYKHCVLKIQDRGKDFDLYIKSEEIQEVIKVLSKKIKC